MERFTKVYSPPSRVAALRVSLVDRSTSRRSAPGTTPPLTSCTVTTIVPWEPDCARAVPGSPAKNSSPASKHSVQQHLCVILSLLNYWPFQVGNESILGKTFSRQDRSPVAVQFAHDDQHVFRKFPSTEKRNYAFILEPKYACIFVFYTRKFFPPPIFPHLCYFSVHSSAHGPARGFDNVKFLYMIDFSMDNGIMFSGGGLPVPVRCRLFQEGSHEEIHQPAFAVSTTGAMPATRNKQKFEVLTGLDKPVRHLKCRGRIDVFIHLTCHKQQLALEAPGVLNI